MVTKCDQLKSEIYCIGYLCTFPHSLPRPLSATPPFLSPQQDGLQGGQGVLEGAGVPSAARRELVGAAIWISKSVHPAGDGQLRCLSHGHEGRRDVAAHRHEETRLPPGRGLLCIPLLHVHGQVSVDCGGRGGGWG